MTALPACAIQGGPTWLTEADQLQPLIMLSVDLSGCTLCSRLWRHTHAHTHTHPHTHSLIILLVSRLAPVILHTGPNQMGCPPLAVSLNSLPVKAARKCVPDSRQALGILERATGSGDRNFLQTPLQLWDFLQRRRDQRPNKAGLFKDKNYAREMNETYSMKCSSRILLLSELRFQIEHRWNSRHARLI